jgi:hypothetical protein
VTTLVAEGIGRATGEDRTHQVFPMVDDAEDQPEPGQGQLRAELPFTVDVRALREPATRSLAGLATSVSR